MKYTFTIEQTATGFSAHATNISLYTIKGKDMNELRKNILDATNKYRADDGMEPVSEQDIGCLMQ